MRLQKTRTIPGLFNYSTPHPRPSGTWVQDFLVPDYRGAIVPEYLGTIFAGYQSSWVPGDLPELLALVCLYNSAHICN